MGLAFLPPSLRFLGISFDFKYLLSSICQLPRAHSPCNLKLNVKGFHAGLKPRFPGSMDIAGVLHLIVERAYSGFEPTAPHYLMKILCKSLNTSELHFTHYGMGLKHFEKLCRLLKARHMHRTVHAQERPEKTVSSHLWLTLRH